MDFLILGFISFLQALEEGFPTVLLSESIRASSCSIGTDRVSSDFRHSNCEVDDQVILFLALQRDLTVVTNDRALGRRVAADRAFTLTKDMADLMKHTHLTMLRRDETDTLWIEV